MITEKITERLRQVPMATVATVLMAGFIGWLLAAPQARALVDTAQVLTGGISTNPAETAFTSPGHTFALGPDTPGTGLGETAVSMVMPAGTLSNFRVKVTTGSVPTSGTITFMVRVNGHDTKLTCQLTGTGQCTSGNKTKSMANNSLLAVRSVNTLVDASGVFFTYRMQYD